MGDQVSLETYRKADDIMRIMRIAVRKAQEESRRLGVPNVYWINGQRYYELPNGDYCRTLPSEDEKS
jgi:hypothetical protein